MRNSRAVGKVFGAAALAVVLSACGAPVESEDLEEQLSSEQSELMNGTLIDSSARWRGVVSLDVLWPDFRAWEHCTGNVSSRRTIITAAHCVTQPLGTSNSGTVTVIVKRQTSTGAWQTLLNGVWVHAEVNPAYNNFAPHDVAVLTSPWDLPYITPSDAVPIGKDRPSGEAMWAVGYGMFTRSGAFDGLGRTGKVTPTYFSSPGEYRFGAGPTDPWLCRGDSGGPIRLGSRTWGVFGIASLSDSVPGEFCGSKGHWAATADNFQWLKSAIGPDKCIEFLNNLMFCW